MNGPEIRRILPGSDEILSIRERAVRGDTEALKDYVYHGAWLKIVADQRIPPRLRPKLFDKLVKKDMVEVKIDGR